MSTPKEELSPSDEALYRQISPDKAWLNDGRVTSVAFSPWPKDNWLLSVSCGSRTTPQKCYEHYTITLGLPSVGVWQVTTQEVADLAMKSHWSPVEPPNPHPDLAHGSIDFRGLDQKAAKTRSKALAAKAHIHGRKYPATATLELPAPPAASGGPTTSSSPAGPPS